MGRRVLKDVDGVVTSWVLDGSEEIADYDGSGTLLRRYIYGAGVDEPIMMVAGDGTKHYFHQDAQGVRFGDR